MVFGNIMSIHEILDYSMFSCDAVHPRETTVITKGSACSFRTTNRFGQSIYTFSWHIPKENHRFWGLYSTFYIGISKCGTHGIFRKINRYNGMGHLFGSQYPKRIRDKLRTIVRNPYDRLVSAYYFMIRGGFNNNPAYLKVASDYKNFADWVLNGLDPKYFNVEGILLDKSWTEAFLPQTFWLLDEEGEMVLDKKNIGRFENLVEDVQRLLNINLDTHENKSKDRHEDWKIYYTNIKVRKKVEKHIQRRF